MHLCLILILFIIALLRPLEIQAQTVALFSPKGGIKTHLLQNIQETKISIDIAAFQLTSAELVEHLLSANKRGVRVKLILDYQESQKPGSLAPFLKERGIEVKTIPGRLGGQMHHTFIIFDGNKVFTGSYSLAEYAEKFNYENALFFEAPSLVNKYLAYFNKLFGEPAEERPLATKHFIGLSITEIQQSLSGGTGLTSAEIDTLWSHYKGSYVRGEGKIIYLYPDLSKITIDDNGTVVEIIPEGPLPPLQEGQKVDYSGRLSNKPSIGKPFSLDKGTIY